MSYYNSNNNSPSQYYRENDSNSLIDSQNSQLNRPNATANVDQPTLDNCSSNASAVFLVWTMLAFSILNLKTYPKTQVKKMTKDNSNFLPGHFWYITIVSHSYCFV